MKTYTEDDVREDMRREFAKSSMSQVARDKSLSVSYLSDVLTGRQGVSDTIAKAFGFLREVTTEVTFRKAS
jgi:transcriptional regulator with XRE-family HTH domain